MKRLDLLADYEKHWSFVEKQIDTAGELPNQLFKSLKKIHYYMDFHAAFEKEFFDGMNAFCNNQGEQFLFSLIEPDPYSYYFKQFGKYPMAVFDSSDSFSSFKEMILEDPGNSPADAIIHNSERIYWGSLQGTIDVVCDRSVGLAVIGFDDADRASGFLSGINPEIMIQPVDACGFFIHGDVETFRANYTVG